MKLSELTGETPWREEDEAALLYPRSDLADPPITPEEARQAETANCRRHGGLIFSSPLGSDIEGRVYLCGAGRQYWRYDRSQDGLYAQLPPWGRTR